MRRTALSDIACSLARTVDIIGEWWTPLILRDLFVGVSRFDDLRRDLGVATNVLADRLATLTERGIVERRQYRSNPPRDEYVLTEKGRDLFPVVAALMRWGDRWEAAAAGPPALLVHDRCGEITTPTLTCDCCGEPVTAEDVTGIAGPGGRAGRGTTVIGPILAERADARRAREI